MSESNFKSVKAYDKPSEVADVVDQGAGEDAGVTDRILDVTVLYAGESTTVPFVTAGESVDYYLKKAGIRLGLFGGGKTATVGGELLGLKALVAMPCTITVNNKVRNGSL